MEERQVRDLEVAGSNPVALTEDLTWFHFFDIIMWIAEVVELADTHA